MLEPMKALSETVRTRGIVNRPRVTSRADGHFHKAVFWTYGANRLCLRKRVLVQSGPGIPSHPCTQVSPSGMFSPSRLGGMKSA